MPSREKGKEAGQRRSAPVAGIVLAAGRSSRYGAPKALVRVEGVPCVRRVARAARDGGVAPLVVVCRAEEENAMAEALAGLPIRLVARPPDAPGGQDPRRAGTLATGLVALGRGDAAAEARDGIACLAVFVADAPFTSAELVAALVAAWRTRRGDVLRPRSEAGPGHPVLFDGGLLPELAALAAEGGAGRALIAAHGDRLHELPVADPTTIADFDTPQALRALLAARRRARR